MIIPNLFHFVSSFLLSKALRTSLSALLFLVVAVACHQEQVKAPNPYEIDAEEYSRVFEASLQILRNNGFSVDRQDYRFGVITTKPRQSGTIAEPWRPDNSTFEQVMLSTASDIRRRVRVTLEPWGDEPLSVPISPSERRRMEARQHEQIQQIEQDDADEEALAGETEAIVSGDPVDTIETDPLTEESPEGAHFPMPSMHGDVAEITERVEPEAEVAQENFVADASQVEEDEQQDLQEEAGVTELTDISPVQPVTTSAHTGGPAKLYGLRVEVVMERRQMPRRFVTASSGPGVFGSLRETPEELAVRGIEEMYWEPIGRDVHLELRLLGEIVRRSTEITDLGDYDFIQP